jgi:hypothetical protein
LPLAEPTAQALPAETLVNVMVSLTAGMTPVSVLPLLLSVRFQLVC